MKQNVVTVTVCIRHRLRYIDIQRTLEVRSSKRQLLKSSYTFLKK